MATAPNEAQLTTKRAKTLSSAALASAAVATASTDDAGEIFTLRAENAQQREEIEVLRRELEELREAHRIEVDDLHAAQAASAAKEQRLVDPDTWCDLYKYAEDGEPTDETRGYEPSEIVVALKRVFDVPYTDDDAKALLRKHGFKAEDVRAEAWVQNNSEEYSEDDEEYFPMRYFALAGDLQMCKWLFAHGAAEDVTKTDEMNGWHPMLEACCTKLTKREHY